MTQGFYEQLGVDPGASAPEIRAAYTRLVANLTKRRKAIVEQGGDPSPLDLARSQADEAWAVLSDPARRRKYDAMRALQHDGWTNDSNELWRKVAGALVHPAAGAAAELLRVATNLKVGAMPPVPRMPGVERRRIKEEDEVTVTATQPPKRPSMTPPAEGGLRAPLASVAKVGPAAPARPVVMAATPLPDDLPSFDDDLETSDSARVVPLPVRTEAPAEPSLKVVDAQGAPVMVMPAAPRRKPVSAEDVARMVDQLGYTGALLRAVREARGLPLQEVSDTTRISVRYLEAIESDQFDALPSATFVRGYVREMARLLALDEEATVGGYMRRLRS
jgi:curved DNA-binding protein CbpA